MGSAPIPGNDRDAIEQILLQEVEQARTAYDDAKSQSAKLMEHVTDLGLNHADGRTALRKANATQSAATERYAKSLKALTDFMVGKAPLP